MCNVHVLFSNVVFTKDRWIALQICSKQSTCRVSKKVWSSSVQKDSVGECGHCVSQGNRYELEVLSQFELTMTQFDTDDWLRKMQKWLQLRWMLGCVCEQAAVLQFLHTHISSGFLYKLYWIGRIGWRCIFARQFKMLFQCYFKETGFRWCVLATEQGRLDFI